MTARTEVDVIDETGLTGDGPVAAVQAPRPLRADARRNVEKIVAAAKEIFAERGSETSLEDVARRAGVGVGTLYRHFPQRINLVEAVYADDIDVLVAVAAEGAGQDDAWAALESWLRAFVVYVERKRNFLTELHEAFEKNPSLRLQFRERMFGAAGAVLARAQAQGSVRTDVSVDDLMQLVGGMCLSSSSSHGSNTRLLAVVLDGIRSAPHPS